MRSLVRAVAVAMLWAVAALATVAGAQERRALVIGNDSYDSLPVLQKARNDALAVAGTLERLGFATTLLEDADRRAMSRAIATLAAAIRPGDEVLFYFAGHGVEVAGRNLLLPVDAPSVRPGDEAFLVSESLALDQIMDTLAPRKPRVTLVILDACRDNPFPREGMRSAGGTRGLAPVAPPEGSFIMFSAGTGQAALDALGPGDPHPNSVFTRALLPLLEAPGLPVQEMARLLRGQVEETARSVNHRQRPAYYDELTADFIVNAGTARGAAPLILRPTDPPAPDPCVAAAREWPAVAALADPALMRAFAETHAACAVFARAAAARADELDPPGLPFLPPLDMSPPSKGAPPGFEKGAPSPPAPTWRIRTGVSEGFMNARNGPGTMHSILFRIPEGTGGLRVVYCGPPDPGGGRFDWCLVGWDGREGWVSINGLEQE